MIDHAWPSERVCSVKTLRDAVDAVVSRVGGPVPLVAWRGVADARWRLTTSLMVHARRQGWPCDAPSLRVHERDRLEQFRLRELPRATREREALLCTLAGEWIWNVMAVARHDMEPTRILDWTVDPLVAAFFACASGPAADGSMWWFDQTAFENTVHAAWEGFGVPTWGEFGGGGGGPVHFVASHDRVLAPSAFRDDPRRWITKLDCRFKTDRMSKQRAFMTLCGDPTLDHDAAIDALCTSRSEPLARGRIEIPAGIKAEVLAFLADLGVDSEALGQPQSVSAAG